MLALYVSIGLKRTGLGNKTNTRHTKRAEVGKSSEHRSLATQGPSTNRGLANTILALHFTDITLL